MTNDEDAYLARMESRQGARSAYLAKARQGAEAIGRDALALKDLGMSVSEIARRVGIPRPTLNEFIAAAEKSEAGAHSATPPATPLPVLSGNELVTAAREGGPVIEIAASFGDADTLFLSGEPFARFVNPNWGSGMRIPNLMLRLEGRGGSASPIPLWGMAEPGLAMLAKRWSAWALTMISPGISPTATGSLTSASTTTVARNTFRKVRSGRALACRHPNHLVTATIASGSECWLTMASPNATTLHRPANPATNPGSTPAHLMTSRSGSVG